MKKWVESGFLNKDIKLPLGAIWSMRTQIEADLLLQNLMLTADAMGLGALDPRLAVARRSCSATRSSASSTARCWASTGSTPRWKLVDSCAGRCRCRGTPTCARNPIGLRHKGEHLIKAMCPPNYDTHGRRRRRGGRRQVRPGRHLLRRERCSSASTTASSAQRTWSEASNYAADVIACTRDICTYIYETHGRFPAHCDTIHVPGVWLQAHHVENEYYERFFRNGLTDAHRNHHRDWDLRKFGWLVVIPTGIEPVTYRLGIGCCGYLKGRSDTVSLPL